MNPNQPDNQAQDNLFQGRAVSSLHNDDPEGSQTPFNSSRKLGTKHILLTVILLVLLIGGLVGYEYSIAQSYRAAFKNYRDGQTYAAYKADMNTFLYDRNGVLSKMYDCSATAEAIWQIDSPSAPKGSLAAAGDATFQYDQVQKQIRTSWQNAIKAQPTYHPQLLAWLLPQAKHARQEHHTLTKLMSDTQAMLDSRGTAVHPYSYCVDKLYAEIIYLQFLQRYSNTTNLRDEFLDNVQAELQQIAKMKNNSFSPYITVPASMAAVDKLFTTTYLTKVQTDLNTLLTIKQKSPPYTGDFGALNTNFASDVTELDGVVLSEAAVQGRTIQPSPAELQSLLTSMQTQ